MTRQRACLAVILSTGLVMSSSGSALAHNGYIYECTHPGWVKSTSINTGDLAGVFGAGTTDSEVRVEGRWKSHPDLDGEGPICYGIAVYGAEVIGSGTDTYCYVNYIGYMVSMSDCSLKYVGSGPDHRTSLWYHVYARFGWVAFGSGTCEDCSGSYYQHGRITDYVDGGFYYECWYDDGGVDGVWNVDPDAELHCTAGRDAAVYANGEIPD